MTRMPIAISAQYLIITMMVNMAIQNLMASLFHEHRGIYLVAAHPKIPGCQPSKMSCSNSNYSSIGGTLISLLLEAEYGLGRGEWTAHYVTGIPEDIWLSIQMFESSTHVYIHKRNDSNQAGEQLVAWNPGNQWWYEPFVDDITGLIIVAQFNTQTTLPGIPAIGMACVKHIVIN